MTQRTYDESYPPSLWAPPAADPPEDPPEDPPVVPDASWTKADILGWLTNNGVDFDASAHSEMNKSELLHLVSSLLDEEG